MIKAGSIVRCPGCCIDLHIVIQDLHEGDVIDESKFKNNEQLGVPPAENYSRAECFFCQEPWSKYIMLYDAFCIHIKGEGWKY